MRETRKQDDREVVTRKKIQWNSVRVEANWKDAAPVRLITNQGEIRIMLRRRIADCAVLANRIEIILDDLLWILSDRQIQATLLCVKSLSEAIEASKEIQKIFIRVESSPEKIHETINCRRKVVLAPVIKNKIYMNPKASNDEKSTFKLGHVNNVRHGTPAITERTVRTATYCRVLATFFYKPT